MLLGLMEKSLDSSLKESIESELKMEELSKFNNEKWGLILGKGNLLNTHSSYSEVLKTGRRGKH